MNKIKLSNLWALLAELIESKFTGKVILEINFSQGGITEVYEYKRKKIKEGVK